MLVGVGFFFAEDLRMGVFLWVVILDGVGVNDLVMGGVEPWSVFWGDEEEGPIFLADDSCCNLSTSNVPFSFTSFSNIGSYLIHCSLIFVSITSQGIPLYW